MNIESVIADLRELIRAEIVMERAEALPDTSNGRFDKACARDNAQMYANILAATIKEELNR